MGAFCSSVVAQIGSMSCPVISNLTCHVSVPAEEITRSTSVQHDNMTALSDGWRVREPNKKLPPTISKSIFLSQFWNVQITQHYFPNTEYRNAWYAFWIPVTYFPLSHSRRSYINSFSDTCSYKFVCFTVLRLLQSIFICTRKMKLKSSLSVLTGASKSRDIEIEDQWSSRLKGVHIWGFPEMGVSPNNKHPFWVPPFKETSI